MTTYSITRLVIADGVQMRTRVQAMDTLQEATKAAMLLASQTDGCFVVIEEKEVARFNFPPPKVMTSRLPPKEKW